MTGVTATFGGISIGRSDGNGYDVSNSQLMIEGGSSVTSSGSVAIGGPDPLSVSANSKIVVNGEDSSLNVTGTSQLRIGARSGAVGSALEVLNKGTVTIQAAILVGGYETGASGGRLLVDGEGSAIVGAGGLNIGRTNDATNFDNRVTISNGAEASFAGNFNIYGTDTVTNNELRVESGGSIALNGTNNRIYYGALTVDGGSVEAKHLALYAGGRVNLLNGDITIEGNLTTNAAGTSFGFDLSQGELTIDITGNLSLHTSAATVNIFGITPGTGSYTLFTFGTKTNVTAARLVLGDAPEGFTGSLAFLDQSVVLNYNYVAIPEPGSVFLLGTALAMGGLCWARRRRDCGKARAVA